MASSSNGADLHPLADIDQVIHAPARLMVLTYLYVVDSADYTFLLRMTGLTWGNLAAHLAKLEEAGYVAIDKGYQGKKPHSIVSLTPEGRAAFREYKRSMQQVLDDLPD
jgi:DNA-binding MarR family transcriptional regulator